MMKYQTPYDFAVVGGVKLRRAEEICKLRWGIGDGYVLEMNQLPEARKLQRRRKNGALTTIW